MVTGQITCQTEQGIFLMEQGEIFGQNRRTGKGIKA